MTIRPTFRSALKRTPNGSISRQTVRMLLLLSVPALSFAQASPFEAGATALQDNPDSPDVMHLSTPTGGR